MNVPTTTRIVITVTPAMQEAMHRQAQRRGVAMSYLVRAVLGNWLEAQGDRVPYEIAWGIGTVSGVSAGDAALPGAS